MAVPQSSPTRLGPPASGAYIGYSLVISATNLNTNVTKTAKMSLPAGMTAVLVGASVQGVNVVSDPAVTIGNTTDVDGYVAAFNLTTNVQKPTIGGALSASGRASIPDGGIVVVQVVNDTGDSFDVLNADLTFYVTEHATNIPDV